MATYEQISCRWELNIEGCKDYSFFRTNIEIELVLVIITFILSTILLLYRRIKYNSILWNGQCFSALDGFLFWADIWCITKVIFIFVQLSNLKNDYLRHFLFELMAFPPVIAVATYASGLFYAIPRMNFQQRTSQEQEPKQILQSKTSLFRPNVVSFYYWMFVSIFFLMTFIPLLIAAVAKQNHNRKLEKICWAFHLLIFSIAFGILAIILVIYSRRLVHLAEESILSSVHEFEIQKYKKFADMMKLFYKTLIFVFVWYILGIGLLAFFRMQIDSHEVLNKTFAAMTELSSIVATLVIICTLLICSTSRNNITLTLSAYQRKDHIPKYNNDDVIEKGENTVVDTRTSWYIGGTRVQPPPPAAQRSPTIYEKPESTNDDILKIRAEEFKNDDFGSSQSYCNYSTQFRFNSRYNGQYNPGFN
ncbi:10161_t:CDS:2 [Funneliformis geosporum]|uniref:8852_t:CDS:1 n=1 Tax=Funneliformis geosporum TaxID=1117311 RepID=A0A9W4SM06_9GLOM|nr:8852_t:CDS:2 [Funneliformis geosporum]CAI2181648.1 10161_t:CDS:2 [Funneliformis geosporum]